MDPGLPWAKTTVRQPWPLRRVPGRVIGVGARMRPWWWPDGSRTRSHRCDVPTTTSIIRYALLALLATSVLVPTAANAGDRTVSGTAKMRAVEAALLQDINRIRVRNGRKPLRLDRPTAQVARARSHDMAAKRYFAHREPDGDNARRILGRRDIGASEVTENIGHTVGLTLREGGARMATWWFHSPPHRRQMLARDINYVGIGIARRGSRFTYTAIFTRSRDKTEPKVFIVDTSWRARGGGTEVTIDWRGNDPRLARGTAGIRRYEVERLTALGGWQRVDHAPQRSSGVFRTPARGDQRFRIRAVDRAGNVGPWAYTRFDLPDRRRAAVNGLR